MTERRTAPEIDGETCVHALVPQAQCSACVDVCPRGALLLDEEGLSLDTQACDACGLCLPSCPRSAMTLDPPSRAGIAVLDDGSAWASCARAAPSPLGCKHALSPRDLDRLADEGVRSLNLLTAPCDHCPRNAKGSFATAVEHHQALRRSRGRSVVEVREIEDPAIFDALRNGTTHRKQEVDRGRRQMFSALFALRREPHAEVGSGALAYHVPRFDPAGCIACDACVAICPDGALERLRGAREGYRIIPGNCSGCGLCVDICAENAIFLDQLAPAGETMLPLASRTCRACGAPFSWPLIAGGTPHDTCRICARHHHSGKLFQVLERK